MISDDLRIGLANLQRRGWQKGAYGTLRGPVCMISALPMQSITDCRPYLREAIQNAHGPLWNVNAWQDLPGRKFAEIEQVYLDAIELAQRDEGLAA